MNYGSGRYITAEEKRAKAAKSLAKLKKKNSDLAPVVLEGSAIAKSWWGKAWMKNLERYADYSNRVGRGKTYVRSNAVLDLKIQNGVVRALVQGSRVKPYEVIIQIVEIPEDKWTRILGFSQNKIASLEDLLAGKFPRELEELLFDAGAGLFPSPQQIQFGCSCPDWANMCKHVAATLYGIANRLDQDPMLFFTLRGRDGQELIASSMELTIDQMLQHAMDHSTREIPEDEVAGIFNL